MVRRNTTHGLQQVTNSGRRTEVSFHERRATATGRVVENGSGCGEAMHGPMASWEQASGPQKSGVHRLTTDGK